MNMHTKSPTLYEANQVVCDDLAKAGFGAIAEMAKHFHKSSEMSRALGFDSSAVSNWLMQRNLPGWSSNVSAANWLSANQSKAPAHAAPAAAEAAPVLMVICPQGASARVTKVLTMLNCEVVEV